MKTEKNMAKGGRGWKRDYTIYGDDGDNILDGHDDLGSSFDLIGGHSADREEKRVTRGIGRRKRSSLTSQTPIREGAHRICEFWT